MSSSSVQERLVAYGSEALDNAEHLGLKGACSADPGSFQKRNRSVVGRHHVSAMHQAQKGCKEHQYWSVVENRRVADGRVVQRHVLCLGEINDSQQVAR